MRECRECGAELSLRPTSCPLCGSDASVDMRRTPVTDVEDYQSSVRALRDQLRSLREEAEAV